MGQTSSHKSSEKIHTLNEQTGMSHLLGLPRELLIKILGNLDLKTLISAVPLVCKAFWGIWNSSKLAKQGFFYRGLAFPLIVSCVPVDESSLQQSQHCFHSNLDLPLKGISHPKNINVHVHTTAKPKDISLSTIYSMVVEKVYSKSDTAGFIFDKTEFVSQLLQCPFENLETLKLTNFCIEYSMGNSISKLKVNSIYLRNPMLATGGLWLKAKKLHVTLQKYFNNPPPFYNDVPFSFTSDSLEDLSVDFSGNYDTDISLSFVLCPNLKRM